MSLVSWGTITSNNTYKNFTLSEKTLRLAVEMAEVFPHTTNYNFGNQMGESVTFPRMADFTTPPNFGRIDEDQEIPVDTTSIEASSIRIYEFGRGVTLTERMRMLPFKQVDDIIKKRLADQMTRVLDDWSANAFQQAKVCFIPTSLTGGTFDVDGTPSTQAQHTLQRSHVGMIRDYMIGTLRTPMINGDHYVGILTIKSTRGLKDSLETIKMYLQEGDFFYKNEIGMYEQCRFVELHAPNSELTNGVGAGSVLGEGLFFGDMAVARIERKTPEIAADPPYDHGRFQKVSFYGDIGFGEFFPTANAKEARIVRLTSS